MIDHTSKHLSATFWAGALLMMVGASVGCSGELTWYCAPDAASRISAAKRVGVITRVAMLEGVPFMGNTSQPEMATAIVGELITRGYQVTVLREQAMQGNAVNTKETLTARAETQPVATIERESSASGAEMTSRYRAARDAKVELLLEFSAQVSQEMKMRMSVNPIPFVPSTTKTEWCQEIRQMSLTISDPEEQIVLGTVTVSYDDAEDDIREVVRDALKGLDMIRQGKPSATISVDDAP